MSHLTEGWPLSPTSTIYMDGTAVYGVRRYGTPGATNVVLKPEHADLIREVVAERIEQVRTEVREQVAREVEAQYLGPDSGRLPDGRAAPDDHCRNAYDEGLYVAARIARTPKETP